jgi:hypothetical protein
MKTLLEKGHYTRTIILLFFPLSGCPNSHQYLQSLDCLLFEYLPSLYSMVQQILLNVTVDLLLLFPLQLPLPEYRAGFLLLGHLMQRGNNVTTI